jgi:hypothetical protein
MHQLLNTHFSGQAPLQTPELNNAPWGFGRRHATVQWNVHSRSRGRKRLCAAYRIFWWRCDIPAQACTSGNVTPRSRRSASHSRTFSVYEPLGWSLKLSAMGLHFALRTFSSARTPFLTDRSHFSEAGPLQFDSSITKKLQLLRLKRIFPVCPRAANQTINISSRPDGAHRMYTWVGTGHHTYPVASLCLE